MNVRDDPREFLTSRRERITPEQAGLPDFGGRRRVTGLRREDVAMVDGMSTEYYARRERGAELVLASRSPASGRFRRRMRPGVVESRPVA